jgi:hypothetical protein
MKKVFVVFSMLTLISSICMAKEITKRNSTPASMQEVAVSANTNSSSVSRGDVGIGFHGNNLAVRHWIPGSTLGVEGILGFTFGDDYKDIVLAGKLLGTIKKERNLIVYWFGMFGFDNVSIKVNNVTDSDTYVLVNGGLGVEFFIPGISNLGLGTEIGLGYDGRTKEFGTFSNWLNTVGIRYYF